MQSQFDTNTNKEKETCSGIYPVHKERGETLAMLLNRFRTEQLIDETVKLTYAGRLDPMAEGLVLILAGDARFQKDALLGLHKTYEVDVLFGVVTDTQDPLGIITDVSIVDVDEITLIDAIAHIKRITSLPYPMYSSVPVDGKPLFVHARAGTKVEVPQKKVTIYSAEIINIREESLQKLVDEIITDIAKVAGDFRQAEITEVWQRLLTPNSSQQEATIVTIRISASSGTYMRSLATVLGERLGVPALAYRINRTKLGEYTL